jgi:phage gp36-like protein
MPYATKADMQTRYGDTELRQLSDIGTPRTGAIVDAVIDRALVDASAWLDSFLVGRYPLPIADTSALARLNLDCAAEARFLMMTVNVDDAAQKAHDERLAFYTAVAKGSIDLIAAADIPPAVGVGPVLFDRGSKVFGREGAELDVQRNCW